MIFLIFCGPVIVELGLWLLFRRAHAVELRLSRTYLTVSSNSSLDVVVVLMSESSLGQLSDRSEEGGGGQQLNLASSACSFANRPRCLTAFLHEHGGFDFTCRARGSRPTLLTKGNFVVDLPNLARHVHHFLWEARRGEGILQVEARVEDSEKPTSTKLF